MNNIISVILSYTWNILSHNLIKKTNIYICVIIFITKFLKQKSCTRVADTNHRQQWSVCIVQPQGWLIVGVFKL